MRIFSLLILLATPISAMAAGYSNAPLLVVGDSASAGAATPPAPAAPAPNQTFAPDFPEWAVTKVGENSAGNENPVPGAPAAPSGPQGPATAQPAPTASAPATPVPPASAADKLWPKDTLPIFMKSCMGFHLELAGACSCVITNLMVAMPHDEFLRLSADGSIERDARLIEIRQRCVATPRREP